MPAKKMYGSYIPNAAVNPDTRRKLYELAEQRNMKPTELVRQIVEQYLDEHAGEIARREPAIIRE
jgi:predicted transcriptional regulator